jgi:hypothetical protein
VILKLVELLLLRAAAPHDAESGERSLLAAWNLATALASREDLLSQMVGFIALRLHAEVTAMLPGVDAAEWERRYASVALEPRMRALLDRELALLVDWSGDERAVRAAYEGTRHVTDQTFAGRHLAPALGARTVALQLAQMRVVDSEGPCGASLVPGATEGRASWLDETLDLDWALPVRVIYRARTADVEMEMTRRILAMKVARAEGRLPPGTDVASVIGPPRVACTEIVFHETVLPDGRLRLQVTGRPWGDPVNPGAARRLTWEERWRGRERAWR